MELVAEGDVSPSAEAVAVRAGVAPRSVFRHFANMDSLYQELNRLISAEVRPMAAQPFQATTLQGHLAEMAERRAAIFDRIMPFKICGDLHRHELPYLAAQYETSLREQREAVRAALPPGLADDRVLLDALDLIFSFEASLPAAAGPEIAAAPRPRHRRTARHARSERCARARRGTSADRGSSVMPTPLRYQVRCVGWIRERFAALDPEARAAVRSGRF